jgi:RNA polymerase sigma-70 factor (ECF subfamily)
MAESEWLARIKADPSVFSEVFQQYYHPIFGYIFRRTANFDDAADIAAETFLNAFRHIQRFNYRGISIKVWLYRIATNEINLYFRHRRKKNSFMSLQEAESTQILSHHLKDDRTVLEAELVRHQQFLTILSHLKKLPVNYQEVLALRYFEGKDNREIGQIMGLKEGTIKSLLSRGLDKLREKCNPI